MKWLLRALEVLAWAGFFAFAALLLVLRFWVLPDIERHRDDIVAAVTRAIGQPVKVGAIEAGWLGLRPQVSLRDVRVYDASGREALVLPEVDNVLSWRSLLYGELRLHALAIEGPRLNVRRDAAGALYVAGMKLGEAADGGRFGDWILGQEEIIVRGAEVEWHDEKRGAPPLALSAVQIHVRNSGREHSFGLSAKPPAALGSTLEVRAELAGRSVTDLAAWNGRLYVELGSTEIAAWRSWIDYPFDLRQGQGALRMWMTLEGGEARQATADVELARVVARLRKDLPQLELASLRGRLQVQTRDGGYEFSGRRLAFAVERGPAMSPSDFRVTWQPAGPAGAERGSVIANLIELEPIAHIAESLPFPVEMRRLLAELAPRGRILDAKLDWTGPPGSVAQFIGRARFAELALRAREALPGFAGLSGSIEASEAKGSLRLATRKGELDLPRLLSEPRVALDSLSGEIDWQRGADGALALTLGAVSFANEHLEGRASGSYAYPGSGRGTADLTVQLSRADGKHVARYLPLGTIMGQATHDYLVAAILDGRASDARLRLKGELRDFPFTDPAKGQFQVTARVEKGVLEYANGWPRLSGIDAQLLFERDRMEITSRAATVLGAKLAGVQVVIAHMGPGVNAHIEVSGQAEGPTGEFLNYIDASPVRRMTGGLTAGMSAAGKSKLRLKMDLPLGDLPATRVTGEYEIVANTVTLQPQLPAFERVTGKIGFTESGFSVHDVRGRLFGGSVVIGGGSRPGAGIEVVAQGDATVAGTQPLINHPWRRYLSGASPYVATLTARDGRTRIRFESSLVGVSSVLPPPFAKGVAETLPLRIDVYPAEGGARDRISIALGQLAAAELLRRRQGEAMVVQRTSIALSPAADQPPRLPERPGTLVYGSLAALNFDRWTPFLSEGGDAAAALDLKIGTLDAYGKRIHDLSLRAGTDAAGWSATVASAELGGDVSYRSERGGQLIARLAHFTLPEDYPGAKPRDPGQTRELPSVDLAADRFSFRGKQFGKVELVARRSGDAWNIEKMTMVNPESSLAGRGQWQTAPASRTALVVELESSNAGEFLARIGYPALVRGGKAKMQADVAWAGDPTTPDYASLSGEVQLQADDGQFLEIEPGIGKLVSLMSLQALPRRLTLDFRDVFSKGFQFDRITSAAHIERGLMALKDFKMRGSAAQVDMSGEVDLAKETQNLQVRVVPSLGDSASTVIALINPLLAFPAAIAQRVLKDPLGHIFAFDYAITGSWADPKVVKKGVAVESIQNSAGPADK